MQTLPYVYQQVYDNQVLQRDRVSQVATVAQGNSVRTLPVGGPYNVNGCQVWVGDVWIMAGQSNMRGFGYLDGDHSKINVFGSNEQWAMLSDPVHRLAESPRRVHHTLPDPTVRRPDWLQVRGASIAPAFADHYHQKCHANVGFVTSAHGGTSLLDWSPVPLASARDPAQDTLYGAMLARISHVGPVTGVLWYQGETDASSDEAAEQYSQNLQTLLSAMRRDIHSELLVVMVQVAKGVGFKDHGWNLVRSAQRHISESDTLTNLVSSIDCEMDDAVHLSARGLRKIGRRLAVAAHDLMEGRKKIPCLDSIVQENTRPIPGMSRFILRLVFSNVNQWDDTHELQGFSIRKRDGTEVPVIVSSRVNSKVPSEVHLYFSRQVKSNTENVYLWYGFGANPICNLVTQDGIGLPTFGPVLLV